MVYIDFDVWKERFNLITHSLTHSLTDSAKHHMVMTLK